MADLVAARADAYRTLPEAGPRGAFLDVCALAGTSRATREALPYTIRILAENAARNAGPGFADDADVRRLVGWRPGAAPFTVPLRVSRVLLPDSSGLPALMDLAALRSALARRGLDPSVVEPQAPVDLVVDHSLTVDFFNRPDAASLNVAREYERNAERYRFLKWAEQAFAGLRIVPPGMGIVHQVHLERLARIVATEERDGRTVAFPEFVVGGDSHTPMVNALGVLAWGVGGVDAESAMLGRAYVVPVPRVVGVRLEGRLREGATTTDLVLTVTERLRRVGVVGAFVEFVGPGVSTLSVPDRATIANMAPEYGATVGFFPVDESTLTYLRQTAREPDHVALVEAHARAAGLFRDEDAPVPAYDELVELDLDDVVPCVAGPRRPQDRVALADVKAGFAAALARSRDEGGFGVAPDALARSVEIVVDGRRETLRHGALAIAAITACTNTSNPSVMLAAGLLARKACEKGLRPPASVKTSLAPGSRVVTRYLEETGLLEPLQRLGFHVVGYGCTTCSGKSGPLQEPVAKAFEEHGLVLAAVASSNRNFEGRIHRQVRAAYLASPPLVVAYALAGRVDLDITAEPLGVGTDGAPVYLRDIWPSREEIDALVGRSQVPDLYRENYARIFAGTEHWQALEAPTGPLFSWDPGSTYLLEPPFFTMAEAAARGGMPDTIVGARVLGAYGDMLTTDHISPAGEIPVESEAGTLLVAHGVAPRAFNAFTMRRGNHEVMVRGTFAHPRIHNMIDADLAPGQTLKLPERERVSVYEAARRYRAEKAPLVVLGGQAYGMGSSRDWAAKGPFLLGVRAVIAESYERIHRANLVSLGVVPLTFPEGESWRSLGLDGCEVYAIEGLRAGIARGAPVAVTASRPDGTAIRFTARAAIAGAAEAHMLETGGIFEAFLERMTEAARVARSRPATG
ncbi:aconitate hydratase AcnA [Salinarimonas sp. NSM]|uniref:aconitate hydratase AcnA n=1 Tax=Salinarimonas sp. NSM TaxID=3458003 RepID=UPI004035ACB7